MTARARRGWWQRWWVRGLAVLAVLFVIASAVGDPDTSSADEESTGATKTPRVKTTRVEPSAEPSASSVAEAPSAEPSPSASQSAPSAIVVPDVVGLTRRDAKRAVTAAGLVVRELRRVPSDQPVGTVLRQGKPAGSQVRPGSPVVLLVAAPYPRVPAVVGQAQRSAVRALRSAGFTVQVVTETVTKGSNGSVLRQSPTSAERLSPGSVVTVVVASVVRPVEPPTQSCTPGYDPCLPPASDYDCAGGSGDGPEYADGPVHITGSDPYDLDNDGDGVACET